MHAPQPISPVQMKQVLDVSRLLVVTADLDLLLRRIAEAGCDLLGCERTSIFLHDPQKDELWTKVALQSKEIRVPTGAGIVGHAFKSNSVIHVPEPYKDPRFNPEPDRKSGFVTRNLLTAPMLDLDGRPVGVVQAVNKKSGSGSFNSGDETMIELLCDQAGVAIQRYNLQQEAIQATALRKEMDLAKSVQQGLIPSKAPQIPGIQAAGFTHAASITGGDCYDLWKTPDGRLGIFVGDATGHGIGPALVVSQTRTLIRAICDHGADPRKLLACANARLEEDLEAGSFVTAFLGFLSPDGTLEWCSAGHGPILIRSAAGEPMQVLDATAPPLGVLPDFLADVIPPATLKPDGVLCVVSDGIPEAFSPAGEQFGVDRLIAILNESIHLPQCDVIARIRQAVRDWQKNDEPLDDQTMVIAAHCDAH